MKDLDAAVVAEASAKVRKHAALLLDLRDVPITRCVFVLGDSGLEVVVRAARPFELVYEGRTVAEANDIAELITAIRTVSETFGATIASSARATYAEQSCRAVALELGGFSGPRTLSMPEGRSGYVVEVQRKAGIIAVMYVQKGAGYARSIARAKMERFVEALRAKFGIRGEWSGLQYHIRPATMYPSEGVLPGDAIAQTEE